MADNQEMIDNNNVAEQNVDEVVEDPVVENALVEDPIVENAEVENPVVEEPAAENAVVENPEAENPVVEENVVENPGAENPVPENAEMEDPPVENPAAENPAVENPEIENPAAEIPEAKKPEEEKMDAETTEETKEPEVAPEEPEPEPTPAEMMKLLSNDDETFHIPRKLLRQSNLITNLFRDLGLEDSVYEDAIPLPNVSGKIMNKVLDWARHHKNDVFPEEEPKERRTDDISEWDNRFLEVDDRTHFEIILAANYLDIKPLLSMCCKHIAHSIKGMSPEAIRAKFKIVNDFSTDEEEQIRRENAWVEP